jgi:drug/metabolite transporter (DMT)-like permease
VRVDEVEHRSRSRVTTASVHEQVPVSFWLLAGLGALAVVTFAGLQNGLGALHRADVLLLGAVLAAAVGYAEGGLLARQLGAWQTVPWALVLAAPLMLALTGVSVAQATPSPAAPSGWPSPTLPA